MVKQRLKKPREVYTIFLQGGDNHYLNNFKTKKKARAQLEHWQKAYPSEYEKCEIVHLREVLPRRGR